MKRSKKYQLGNSPITPWLALLILLLIPKLVWAENVTHTYDNLNRLTRTDYGNGKVVEYTYDAAGNRLTQVVNAPNQMPIANAGMNQIVNVGTLVTLDGSASSDPDKGPSPLT